MVLAPIFKISGLLYLIYSRQNNHVYQSNSCQTNSYAPAPFLSNFSLGLSSSGQLLMPDELLPFSIFIIQFFNNIVVEMNWPLIVKPYFFFSHLLHNSGSLVDGRTPKILAAIIRYKNPSSSTLHFLHFLDIADQCLSCLSDICRIVAPRTIYFKSRQYFFKNTNASSMVFFPTPQSSAMSA